MHSLLFSNRLKGWLGACDPAAASRGGEKGQMLFDSTSILRRVLSSYIRQLPLSPYPCFTPTTALHTCYLLCPPAASAANGSASAPVAASGTTTVSRNMCAESEKEASVNHLDGWSIGELYKRAVARNMANSTLPLQAFAEQLLHLSPLFVDVPNCTPEQVRFWQRCNHLPHREENAACLPLQDIKMRWQDWVTDEVLSSLLSPSKALQASSMETPSLLLQEFLPLEDPYQHHEGKKEVNTWQAMLCTIPTFYVPVTLLQQHMERQACSASQPPTKTLEWATMGQLPFAAALEWSLDRSLVRLASLATFTTGRGVGCPEAVARTFYGHGNAHFMLLPDHIASFHAVLDLVARVTPTFFVPPETVREHFSFVMKTVESEGNNALLLNVTRERFPSVEALLTHPDFSFAVEMVHVVDGVPKVRLHPSFAHPHRGKADVFYDLALCCQRVSRGSEMGRRSALREGPSSYTVRHHDTWEDLCACFSKEETVLMVAGADPSPTTTCSGLVVLPLGQRECSGPMNTVAHVWHSSLGKEEMMTKVNDTLRSDHFPAVAICIVNDSHDHKASGHCKSALLDPTAFAAVLSSRKIGKTEKTAATRLMCSLPFLAQFTGYPLDVSFLDVFSLAGFGQQQLGSIIARREGLQLEPNGVNEHSLTHQLCTFAVAAHELLLGNSGDLEREVESLSSLLRVHDAEERRRQLRDRGLTLRLVRYLQLLWPSWERTTVEEDSSAGGEGSVEERSEQDRFYDLHNILHHPTRAYGAPLKQKEALLQDLQRLCGPEVWRARGRTTTTVAPATANTTSCATTSVPRESPSTLPATHATEEVPLSTNSLDAKEENSGDGARSEQAVGKEFPPTRTAAAAPSGAARPTEDAVTEEEQPELPEFLLDELTAQHVELQHQREETRKGEVDQTSVNAVQRSKTDDRVEPRTATKKIKRKTLGDAAAQPRTETTVSSPSTEGEPIVKDEHLDDFLSQLLATKTNSLEPAAAAPTPSRKTNHLPDSPRTSTPPPPPPPPSPSPPSSLFGGPPSAAPISTTALAAGAPNLFSSPSWGRGDFLPRSSFQEGRQAPRPSATRPSGFGQSGWKNGKKDGSTQRPHRGQRGSTRDEQSPAAPKYGFAPCEQRRPSVIDNLASEVVQVSTDYMRSGSAAAAGVGRPNLYTATATSTADALRELLHTDAGRSFLRDLLEEK